MFEGEIKPVKIQNFDFAHMKVYLKIGDFPRAYQEYFVIRKELQPILASIRFSK